MVRDEFLKEVARIAYIAEELAKLHAFIGEGSYPEKGPTFGPDGATFYHLENDPYEDGQSIYEYTVPWAEIDDFVTVTAQLNQKHEEQERARKQQAVDWERAQYERLKARFEKQP